jgi:hypothetical protein
MSSGVLKLRTKLLLEPQISAPEKTGAGVARAAKNTPEFEYELSALKEMLRGAPATEVIKGDGGESHSPQ